MYFFIFTRSSAKRSAEHQTILIQEIIGYRFRHGLLKLYHQRGGCMVFLMPGRCHKKWMSYLGDIVPEAKRVVGVSAKRDGGGSSIQNCFLVFRSFFSSRVIISWTSALIGSPFLFCKTPFNLLLFYLFISSRTARRVRSYSDSLSPVATAPTAIAPTTASTPINTCLFFSACSSWRCFTQAV
jgi:hypothetical protein